LGTAINDARFDQPGYPLVDSPQDFKVQGMVATLLTIIHLSGKCEHKIHTTSIFQSLMNCGCKKCMQS